jgi:hypothetical protein
MRLFIAHYQYKCTDLNKTKRHDSLINILKLNIYFKKKNLSENYFQVIFSSNDTLRFPSGCTSV